MGARLMAIVAEGDRGRVYLEPTEEQEVIAQNAMPQDRRSQTCLNGRLASVFRNTE